MTYNLIGTGNNAKTIKGDGSEYVTAIKYMQPYKTVYRGKVHNLCAMADKAGCAEPCLKGAGRGQMQSVQRGRERKTMFYLSDRIGFMDALINDIKNELPSEIDYRRIEFVGPKVGKELQIMGIKAVLFSLIAMFAYIWFRFSGWQFGLGALVALFHDVLSTIGFFSLTQLEFNLASIAAILTIAGYSINDTVVVFDRIRENLSKKESPFSDLLNLSINQTLSRTFMTSLTTLLALLALYIFGGEVVRGFVSAMMWGVLIGTYSSIFIASPLIALLGFKIFKQNQ